MNSKIFNLEIKKPIDFENPFIIDNLVKEEMLAHLQVDYKILSVSLSLNRKDNYVIIVVVSF